MQTKRLWLAFILISFYVSDQTKGVVVDESGKPILEAGLYDVWIGTASEQLPLHKVVKVVK
jgi:hypothetical protein